MTKNPNTTNPTETDPIVEIGRQLMELEMIDERRAS